jgi:hypothetical protein
VLLLQNIERRLRLAFERIEHRDKFDRGARAERLIASPRAASSAADEGDFDYAAAIRSKSMRGIRHDRC